MKLNFWDTDSVETAFKALFQLDDNTFWRLYEKLLSCLPCEPDFVRIFCEGTGIKLDNYDPSHDIEFLGKIISTTIDNMEHLQKNGLIPIDVLLENDSPLRKHLKEFEIEINPSKKEFIYKGTTYYLPYSYDDLCEYNQRTKMFDDKELYHYWDSFCVLSSKLFSDKSEIEMFVYASEREMMNYSTVSRYPEILCTINQIFQDYFQDNGNIQLGIEDAWIQKVQEVYIISVNVNLSDITFLSRYIKPPDQDAWSIYNHYSQYCENDYWTVEQIPACFWYNTWLINTCLSLITPTISTSAIYAGIKHQKQLPFSSLQIESIRSSDE